MIETKSRLRAIRAAALACLLTTAPVMAQQPAASPASQPAGPALRAKAIELAKTVQPASVALPAAMAALDTQFVEAMRADDNVAALEAEYPGIVDATWKALRPIMLEEMERSVPKLWDLIADIYARHLTAAEIDSAKAFFSGPTGQKFILLMHNNVDVRPMLGEVLQDPEVRFDSDDYMRFIGASADRTAGQMSPAEIDELARFLTSPSGVAIRKVIPDMRQLGVSWFNTEDPEFEARIEKVTLEAMAEFVARQDRKTARTK
jgi:hypothetical protein